MDLALPRLQSAGAQASVRAQRDTGRPSPILPALLREAPSRGPNGRRAGAEEAAGILILSAGQGARSGSWRLQPTPDLLWETLAVAERLRGVPIVAQARLVRPAVRSAATPPGPAVPGRFGGHTAHPSERSPSCPAALPQPSSSSPSCDVSRTAPARPSACRERRLRPARPSANFAADPVPVGPNDPWSDARSSTPSTAAPSGPPSAMTRSSDGGPAHGGRTHPIANRRTLRGLVAGLTARRRGARAAPRRPASAGAARACARGAQGASCPRPSGPRGERGDDGGAECGSWSALPLEFSEELIRRRTARQETDRRSVPTTGSALRTAATRASGHAARSKHLARVSMARRPRSGPASTSFRVRRTAARTDN
jgi:hypothetical protein